jgi:hypothetical protein
MAQRYDRPLTARADAHAQLRAPQCCPGAPVGRENVADVGDVAIDGMGQRPPPLCLRHVQERLGRPAAATSRNVVAARELIECVYYAMRDGTCRRSLIPAAA